MVSYARKHESREAGHELELAEPIIYASNLGVDARVTVISHRNFHCNFLSLPIISNTASTFLTFKFIIHYISYFVYIMT